MTHLQKSKWTLWLETYALLASLLIVVSVASTLVFGAGAFILILAITIITVSFHHIPGPQMMRILRAREVLPWQAPRLAGRFDAIVKNAGLSTKPRLYILPTSHLNAFSVGSKAEPAVAISQGLLQILDERECAGVLAHEVGHIVNHDIALLSLAALLSRLTRLTAMLGLFFAFFSLPFIIVGAITLPPTWLLAVFLAPTLTQLLLLAIARKREYAADLEAVALTNDPLGLASALQKLAYHGPWRWLWQQTPRSDWAQTHPATGKRIQRLLALNVI